jgi:hypothetical protein
MKNHVDLTAAWNESKIWMMPKGVKLIGGGGGAKRELPDGTLDPKFECLTQGFVNTLAQLRNGDVFIGGDFTTVNRNSATTTGNRFYRVRVKKWHGPASQ